MSSPKAKSCRCNKDRARDCQEAWLMIALHVGYKANIKAAQYRTLKAVARKGGHGSKDGPNMAPSDSPF